MHPIIFHIDVNSAFLSWSALNKLENGSQVDLRCIPSIICGDSEKRHGVVLAKSIPTKIYHIETGEPVVNALRKCPILVMEPPNLKLYPEKQHKLDTAIDSIRKKYGSSSIVRGSFLDNPDT